MDPIEKAQLLLIRGASAIDVQRALVKDGMSMDQAGQIVADARRAIVVTADYNRDEELGRAKQQLEDLYRRCLRSACNACGRGADEKTALNVRKELSRLLGLAQPGGGGRKLLEAAADAGAAIGDDISAVREQLDLIGSYLRPLGLVEATYPVSEHARAAAEMIRAHGLGSGK